MIIRKKMKKMKVQVEKRRVMMMMVKYIYADDDDSKDLAVIQDQAIGAPQENQEEPKKKG